MNIAVPRRDRADAPGGADGPIVRADAPDEVVAVSAPGNPLSEEWAPPDGAAPLVLAWSGTLADDLFALHPFTWLRPGHEALAAFCDRVAMTAGRRLVLHPHARHVLSDARSCATFLADRGAAGPGVALAPASLLEVSMMGDLDDHLVRMFQMLGPIAELVVLHDTGGVPLGGGALPRGLVRSLLAEHVPPDVPVVLFRRDLDRQREWLAG